MATKTPVKSKAVTKNTGYSLEMTFNGESITVETDDVDSALKAMKPELLHTESYVTVRKGEFMAERRLSRVQTQRVFLDDVTRQVFVQNLLLN